MTLPIRTWATVSALHNLNVGNVIVVQDPNDSNPFFLISSPGVTDYGFGINIAAMLNSSGLLANAAFDQTTGKLVAGVAAGYKVARGVAAITGSGTVATGLATVVAVVGMLQEDASLTNGLTVTGTIGDQAGSPAAGSVILKVWKSTAANDATPIASGAAVHVNWIAIGT